MDPIMVSDHVDICDMFETEVDMATGRGWEARGGVRHEQPGRHVAR